MLGSWACTAHTDLHVDTELLGSLLLDTLVLLNLKLQGLLRWLSGQHTCYKVEFDPLNTHGGEKVCPSSFNSHYSTEVSKAQCSLSVREVGLQTGEGVTTLELWNRSHCPCPVTDLEHSQIPLNTLISSFSVLRSTER